MSPELEDPHQETASGVKHHSSGGKKGKVVKGIDGLKGIAILGVTLYHLFPAVGSGGFLGVSLFFLLSGYLLAFTTNLRWKQHTYSVGRYFVRRAQRLFIPLILMVTVVLGLCYAIVPDALAGIRPEIISIFLGYNNWWQIAQNTDYFTRLVNTSPFTHMWFMGVELQYIVVWPLLFWTYRLLTKQWGYKLGLVWIGLLTVCASMIMPLTYSEGMDVSRFYYGTDTRVFALLLGAALGLHRSEKKKYRKSTAQGNVIGAIWLTLATIATGIGYFYLDGQSPLTYTLWMTAYTVLFAFMVWLVERPSTPLGSLVDIPILKWLGQHSYGLFLWQYPIIYLFEQNGILDYFESPIGYYIVLVLTIILVSAWSEAVTNWCLRQTTLRDYIAVVRTYFIKVVSVVAALCVLLGIYALATVPAEKQQDVNELQLRLTRNAASQAAENAKEVDLTSVDDPKGMIHMAAIGDSVMLGSSHAMRKDFAGIQIDAKVSRYVGAGLDVAKQFDAQNLLGDVVLVGLGTNGPITGYYEDKTKAFVDYLGSERQIFWVNNYAPGIQWIDENNEYLKHLAEEHPNIHIIDWASLAAKHRDWLGDDGIHPNDTGVKEYSKFIHDEMKKELLKIEADSKSKKHKKR